MFIDKLIVRLPEKKSCKYNSKLEIKYLLNNIISIVYYIFMPYVKKIMYNNCYLGLPVKYL